ncbi:MAG: P1 family peptidase [Bryobacteraceae bacterium]
MLRILIAFAFAAVALAQPLRIRDLGCVPGRLPTAARNAITDVPGVRVGHATVVRGESIRTGVTAILPHSGNLFREKIRGAVFTANGFGKLAGSTQVNELGEIESPIVLTGTLAVPRVADGVLDYMLGLPGNEDVRSLNPLVAETNDGQLNDIRARAITSADVATAIRGAAGGAVAMGSVGAGAGTVAFGWKGGIGTSSRRTPAGHIVGVLVQSNFGGDLTICGHPVGRKLQPGAAPPPADGSIIVVVATDAPADHRQLMRLAARATWGIARTGSTGSNGSGDYAIAFTTHRRPPSLSNDAISPLFEAVIEATEEAIYDSLVQAKSVTGYRGRTVPAIPHDKLQELLRQ